MENLKTHLIYLLIFVLPNVLSAQTLNLQTIPSDKMQFGFKYDKAFYSSEYNWSTLSGVYQLNVNIPISSKLNIIGDIPYIVTNYEIDIGFFRSSYSQNGFGNIFIGLQTKPELITNKKSIITFGVYLPTASEEESGYGLTEDRYYFPKYFPNSFSLYFNYAYHQINTVGLNYGLELGPDLLIPIKGNNTNMGVFVHYGLILGYQINRILISSELVGFGILSEDVENFGDRFLNMVDIGAQWKDNNLIPRVFYKIYLKDTVRDYVDGVWGMGVIISI